MRRFATTAALSLALVAGGSTAATAQATPAAHSSTSVTRTTSDGPQTLAMGSTLTSHEKAQNPTRRRYRTRTRVVRRRSFASRIFGFLGFLLCLPVLLILIIALVFMMRRNRRRREEEMMMRQDQFDRYQR